MYSGDFLLQILRRSRICLKIVDNVFFLHTASVHLENIWAGYTSPYVRYKQSLRCWVPRNAPSKQVNRHRDTMWWRKGFPDILGTALAHTSSCFRATSATAGLLFTGLGESLSGELKCVSNVCVQQLPVKQTDNLAEANASEEDKIRAMMIQSCHQYDPIK